MELRSLAPTRIVLKNPGESWVFLAFRGRRARRCGRMLHRILHRIDDNCTAYCSASGRSFVVLVRDLQIVGRCNPSAVADPLTDDVQRVLRCKLRLSGRPKVLERPRPRLEPGPADDPVHVRAEVLADVPVARDDVRLAFPGQLERFVQQLSQFREDRQEPFAPLLVGLFLRRSDANPVAPPIDVFPSQVQMLRRAAEPAESREGEDEPPLQVRASVEDCVRHFPSHEERPGAVDHARDLHFKERIRRDELSTNCRAEELTSVLQRS